MKTRRCSVPVLQGCEGLWSYDYGHVRYRVPSPPPPLYSPYYIPGISIGWVGVGWLRHCNTRLSLRQLDSQGAVFFFWRSPRLTVELDHFCAERTLPPQKGDDRIT